ncbi:MAG: septum formation initiator family protein [Alphaproteobacteria bacterium]|nr:septum formation initiator family protein [Alphaproteobacteria bacterium]
MMMRRVNNISREFIYRMGVFLIVGYFIIHGLGLGGGKGYLSLGQLDEDINAATIELAALRDHREWLEHRVSLVAEDEIDEDFLGEIARAETGLFAADEIVIDFN